MQLFEMRKTWNMRRWNCINQSTTIRTISLQNTPGTEVDNKREWAVLTMCLCFLLATPFCLGVSTHEVWWMVASKTNNS